MFSKDTLIALYYFRINLLEQRDSVVNAKIIKKLYRKIRKLEESV